MVRGIENGYRCVKYHGEIEVMKILVVGIIELDNCECLILNWNGYER